MTVRPARKAELAAVMNVLDGAVLEADAATVRERIGEGDALVATSADGERVLGALVLDGTRIESVAVRRRRRGQGIGTALVEAAADRRESLTAEFDADLRPFYAGLGFDIEATEDGGRLRGRRELD